MGAADLLGSGVDPLPSEELPLFLQEKLAQLEAVFPTKSSSELMSLVLLHRDEPVSTLVNRISHDVDNHVHKEYALEVYQLLEMFPDVSIERINEIYESSGENLDAALAKLFDRTNEPTQNVPTEKVLADLLGVNVDICQRYLDSRQGDYTKALVEMVIHEFSLDRATPAASSRVQRNKKSGYVYDKRSSEAKELQQMYHDNPQMKLINEEFMKKLLVSVKGDMSKVVEIVWGIIENNCELLTHGDSWKEQKVQALRPFSRESSQEYTVSMPKSAQKLVNSRRQHNTHLGKVSSTRAAPVNRNSSALLDLHELTLEPAMRLVRQNLDAWWSQEQDSRVTEGRIDRYGHQAEFVDPFKVVTGRGLHSLNGKPVIRISVGKYLNLHQYIYEEESWGYIVYGKK